MGSRYRSCILEERKLFIKTGGKYKRVSPLKALTAPKGSILLIEVVGTLFKFLKTKIVSYGKL